jgi:hypothetical protein
MIGLLLKLSLLKRLILLITGGAGNASPAMIAASAVGLGALVGVVGVVVVRRGAIQEVSAPESAESPLMVAVIGLALGGLAMGIYLLLSQ